MYSINTLVSADRNVALRWRKVTRLRPESHRRTLIHSLAHVCKRNVYFQLHLELLCCLLQHELKSHEKQTWASIINKLPPCQMFTLNSSSISGEQQPSVWPYRKCSLFFSSETCTTLRFYRIRYFSHLYGCSWLFSRWPVKLLIIIFSFKKSHSS